MWGDCPVERYVVNEPKGWLVKAFLVSQVTKKPPNSGVQDVDRNRPTNPKADPSRRAACRPEAD
ncbi:MAG: hypothetical protein BGO59_04540 [Spirosoma sp. 48-14]|nr:MAG: hypothetical protein BGO59_04540 [Spirosoma sp. 48-14]